MGRRRGRGCFQWETLRLGMLRSALAQRKMRHGGGGEGLRGCSQWETPRLGIEICACSEGDGAGRKGGKCSAKPCQPRAGTPAPPPRRLRLHGPADPPSAAWPIRRLQRYPLELCLPRRSSSPTPAWDAPVVKESAGEGDGVGIMRYLPAGETSPLLPVEAGRLGGCGCSSYMDCSACMERCMSAGTERVSLLAE